ncbi:MAG: histidine kinase dimerization/phosphoacceptor domain -containing protein [Spirochaetota bacterium]
MALGCLYFDGQRALLVASLFGVANTLGWYFRVGHQIYAVDDFLVLLAIFGITLSVSWLEGRSLALSRLDTHELLQELHHRVRNMLQSLLALWHLEEESGDRGEGRAILGSHLGALATIQSRIPSSPDFSTLDLAEVLDEVAVQVGRALGRPSPLRLRGGGKLHVSQAAPLALLAADLAARAANRPGTPEALLEVLADKAGVVLRIFRTGEARSGREESLKLSLIAEGLLQQLDATALSLRPGELLSFAFKASPVGLDALSSLRGSSGLQKRQLSPFVEFLMGKRQLSGSWSVRRRAGSLAWVYLCVFAAFIAIEASSLAAGTGFRVPGLALLASVLVAWPILRFSGLAASAGAFGVLLAAIGTWAALWGEQSSLGIQLYVAQALFVSMLYFVGRKAAAVAMAWGVALYLAWLFFHPAHELPSLSVLFLFLTFVLFAILAYFVTVAHAKDLMVRESLVHELQHRQGSYLELVGDLAVNPALRADEGINFRRVLDALSLGHDIVTASKDLETIEISEVLEGFARSSVGLARPKSLEISMETSGSLPVEKAILLILLASELSWLLAPAGTKAGSLAGAGAVSHSRLAISAAVEDGQCHIEVSMASTEPEGFRPARLRSRSLDFLETRLGGTHLPSAAGSYLLVFPL